MRRDFRSQLLIQIEMLRGDISHEEFSRRLGAETERYLARYVAGKVHLLERDFYQLAKALGVSPRVLAEQWAAVSGPRMPLRLSDRDAVEWVRRRAYHHWWRHSRLAQLPANRVPSNPSSMTIIREKYADRLPRETPPLCFRFHGKQKSTPERKEQFARAYRMLVQFVHDRESQRTIGAMQGFSSTYTRQLMHEAALIWAKSVGIDLVRDKSVPFKSDAKLVKNLYAGLRFFAQQQFNVLALEGAAK